MSFKHWLIEHENTIKVHVKNVKQQKDYSCGAAVLKSILHYYGVKVTENAIRKIAGTSKKGTDTQNLILAARHYGLKTKAKHNMNLRQLKQWLNKNRAVVVCLQTQGKKEQQQNLNLGHYMIAIGYDSKYIYFEDPYQNKGYRGCISIDEFMDRWKDSTSEGMMRFRWGLALWKEGEHPVFPDKINKVKEV